jgi:hypothetical protein
MSTVFPEEVFAHSLTLSMTALKPNSPSLSSYLRTPFKEATKERLNKGGSE